MDPRQMVALRKALGGGGPEAPQAPDMGDGPESAAEMMVKCPGCGEVFDAQSPEAQVHADASADAPMEG